MGNSRINLSSEQVSNFCYIRSKFPGLYEPPDTGSLQLRDLYLIERIYTDKERFFFDAGFVRDEETLQPSMYLNKYGECFRELPWTVLYMSCFFLTRVESAPKAVVRVNAGFQRKLKKAPGCSSPILCLQQVKVARCICYLRMANSFIAHNTARVVVIVLF